MDSSRQVTQSVLLKQCFEKVKDEINASKMGEFAELVAKKSCVVTKRHQSNWVYEEIRQLVCNGKIERKSELD